jgi:hypothetical protein
MAINADLDGTVLTADVPKVGKRLFGLICLVAVTCSCVGARSEGALRERVDRYEKSWAEQSFGEVWQIMSPRLRRGNDNDQSKFESSVRASGALISKIEIEEIRFVGHRAYVRALVSYQSPSGEPLGDQVEESQWIQIRDAWFFDDYRVL